MNEILLVEDDDSLADSLSYYLNNEGFKVVMVKSIKEAKEKLENKIDLIILDINLPDGNGYDFCKYIRESKDIPVVFLTALDEEENVVKGLELGADDYIIKPFRARELLSRIKSLLRRVKKIEDILMVKDIKLDPTKFKVYKKEKEIILTSLEYRLLLYFLENKNRVLTREQILDKLWDNSGKFVNDNTLTVYIKRIREKLKDNKIIKTVKGIGYILEDKDV